MTYDPKSPSKNLVESTSTAHSMEPKLDPGKSIPTARLPGVGDPYIDKGTPCDADPSGPQCILESDVRAKLVRTYQNRVGIAHGSYIVALTELRVDELLKRDDADIGWIMNLVIGVTTGYIGVLAAGALKMLASLNTAERMAQLAPLNPTKPIAIAFSAEKQIDGLMAALAGTARGYATISAVGSKVATAQGEHQRVVGFIDKLKSGASVLYQHLAEGPPATASDEAMIGLWQAMDATHHSVDQYKQVLGDQIQRFKQSKASWIGTRDTNLMAMEGTGEVEPYASKDDEADLRSRGGVGSVPSLNPLTTTIVWRSVIGQNFGAAELCYYDDRPRDNGQPQQMGIVGVVEPEFRDVAIERYKRAFGEMPKAMVIDGRSGPDPRQWRVVVDPFAGGKVPRLQLGGAR